MRYFLGDGLQCADWHSKRDLVRALVRRVEIGPDGVKVVCCVDQVVPSWSRASKRAPAATGMRGAYMVNRLAFGSLH
jgi:hypothetical protein